MDSDIEKIRQSNAERFNRLAQQGHVVNGLADHYQIELLEQLVSADVELVRERHELWVADQLDAIERQIKHHALLQGVHLGNGKVQQ